MSEHTDDCYGRILRRLADLGMEQQELATAIVTSPAYLSRCLSNRKGLHKHIPAIARELRVSKRWLETGEGERKADEASAVPPRDLRLIILVGENRWVVPCKPGQEIRLSIE